MFETLSDRLTSALGTLTGKGRLSEKDIEAALRQVRMALLEADVDFKVARSFVSKIREEAQGEEVIRSLTPGQTVVKIVQDNLVEVLGGDSAQLQRGDTPSKRHNARRSARRRQDDRGDEAGASHQAGMEAGRDDGGLRLATSGGGGAVGDSGQADKCAGVYTRTRAQVHAIEGCQERVGPCSA